MASSKAFLVIGGAGLVGRHVLAALEGRNRYATHHRVPVADGIALDITDRQVVEDTIARVRPSVVVLAAADPFVERCELRPDETRRVNVDATMHVWQATTRAGALLVVFFQ